MENVVGYKNLKIRDGKYYWRQRIKGKMYFESLHVPDTGRKTEEKEAVARMLEKQRLARDQNFSALQETRTKTTPATIGKIIESYKSAAKSYGISPNSVRQNSNALKLVISTATGTDAEGQPATVLTDKLARDYRDKVIAGRDDDEASQDTARRTIKSTLTQARAVFAKWTYDDYKKLKLPDLTGFRYGGAVRAKKKIYTERPKDLVASTIKAGRKLLADEKDGLAAVFILAYEAGLRAGEIKEAKKDWIKDNLIIVKVGKTMTTRGVERKIPLNPETVAELRGLFREGENYILPGKHKTDRAKLVDREFSAWMRSIGWSAETYRKPTHELRKLRGSRWYTDQGANVAQTLLGHNSVATTCEFYAALDKLPDALPRES